MSTSHQPPPDSTTRFSDRVADYVRYRPGYPGAVLETLRARCELGPNTVAADVGAGTGIFTKMLLSSGATVHAIEPNAAMRTALEEILAGEPGLHTHAGTAEQTPLPDRSVDLIAAAQAFHWFERDAARQEFERILRPGGWVALIWNERLTDASLFLTAYERMLLRWSPDYETVDHRQMDTQTLATFFGTHAVETITFSNEQRFDLAGLRGRLMSSSYAPSAEHPNHEPMLGELERIFREHQVGGYVDFRYRTDLHLSRFGA